MNIVQLRSFVAVVEAGSFSGAARRLRVSQPAVTMQIRALEGELDQGLLDRKYRTLHLTEAGRALLPFAKRMLALEAQAHDSLRALTGTVGGPLTVAASTTPGDYVVPPLLGAFTRRYPEVHLAMMVDNTQKTVEAVESGAADLGLCGALLKGRRVDYSSCGNDELLPICAPDDELAGREQVVAADLCGRTWVMRNAQSGTQRVVRSRLKAAGVEVDELPVAVELDTGEAVVAAVEGGLGVAVVSRFVAEKALQLGTVREIALAGRAWKRPFYLVLPHRTLSRAAEAFREFLQEALEAAPAAGGRARAQRRRMGGTGSAHGQEDRRRGNRSNR